MVNGVADGAHARGWDDRSITPERPLRGGNDEKPASRHGRRAAQPFFHSFLALHCRIGIINLLVVMSTAIYL
jgi:hypothetical protein